MDVQQLAPGLWRWTAYHPDWTPEEGGVDGWDPEVGCIYCETADGIVLVDPLVPAEPENAERFWSALDRDVGRVGGAPRVLLTDLLARSQRRRRRRALSGNPDLRP